MSGVFKTNGILANRVNKKKEEETSLVGEVQKTTPPKAKSGAATYSTGFESSKNSDDYINTGSPFAGYAITSKTGARSAPTAGASTNHAGIDRAMPAGTSIILPMDTTFYRSGSDSGRGNWIEVKDSKGNIAHFQHLDSVGMFTQGQSIPAGTVLAKSGNSGAGTGAHLHEEYYSPNGVNITESYWSKYAGKDASGAAALEYTPKGSNVFNVGTNRLALKGQSVLSGSVKDATPFQRYMMLKNSYDERKRERAEREKKREAENIGIAQTRGYLSSALFLDKNEREMVRGVPKAAYKVLEAPRKAEWEARKAEYDALLNNIDMSGFSSAAKEKAKNEIAIYNARSAEGRNLGLENYMSDAEIALFAEIKRTQGDKPARAYLDYLSNELDIRRSKEFTPKMTKAIEDISRKNALAGYGMNAVFSLGSVGGYINSAARMIGNAAGNYTPIDKDDPIFQGARMQAAAARGRLIDENGQQRTGIRGLFETAALGTTQSLGAAPAGPLGLYILAGSAAGQSMVDALDEGVDPVDAFANATMQGALEWLTEKLPFDDIMKIMKTPAKGVKKLAWDMLKHAGGEFGEEFTNNIAGNIAEQIILGDRSSYVKSAKEYTAQAMQYDPTLSVAEATKIGAKEAFFDVYVKDSLYAGLVGGLSGAMNAAGANVIGDMAQTARAYSKSGMYDAIGKLGYDLEFTDDTSLEGMVDKDTKTIYISSTRKNPLRWIIKHEMSHIIEDTEQGAQLRQMLKEEMPTAWKAAEGRIERLYERANRARVRKGEKPLVLDADTLEAEVAAELGEVLKSERYIRNFAVGENMPMAMKAIEFSRNMAQKAKERFGTDVGWAKAARMWGEALERAAQVKGADDAMREKISDNIDNGGVWDYTDTIDENEIPYREMMQLREYVLSKNNRTSKSKSVGGKEVGSHFYMWINRGKNDFDVVRMIEIEGNEEKIDFLRSELKNGSNGRNAPSDGRYVAERSGGGSDTLPYADVGKAGTGQNDVRIYNGEYEAGRRTEPDEGGHPQKSGTDKSSTKANRNKITDPGGTAGELLSSFSTSDWLREENTRLKERIKSVIETPANEKITLGMSDDVRAELLNKKSVNVVSVDAEKAKALDNIDLDALQKTLTKHAQPIIEKVAKDFGILNKTYFNPDIELDFKYSSGSLKESMHKQRSRYGDFIKMLSVFSGIIKNAVGVETHKDKYTGTRRGDTNLKQMYVLASAFSDEKGVYPVKLEVKEFKKNTNKLYLSVVLTKKESRYQGGNLGQDQLNTAPPTSTISISDLVGIVNPSEGDFLKYFPDSMLDGEQIEGKNKALAKEAEKVEKLTENKKGDVSFKSKSKAATDSSSLGETSPVNAVSQDNDIVNSSVRNDTENYTLNLTDKAEPALLEEEKTSRRKIADPGGTAGELISGFSTTDWLREENTRLKERIKSVIDKNEDLNHRISIARRFFRDTAQAHVDAMDIANYAKELKKRCQTHLSAKEIARRLGQIYTYMSNSIGNEANRDEASQKAYADFFALAEDILSERDIKDRYMYDTYADLRARLKRDGISISKQDRADIADFEEFRKRNFGRVNITNSGISVDSYYEELLELYPELFDKNISAPSDRLKEIVRVRDLLDIRDADIEYTDEDVAGLAGDMFAQYFDDKNASDEQQRVVEAVRNLFNDKWQRAYSAQEEYIKDLERRLSEKPEQRLDRLIEGEANKEVAAFVDEDAPKFKKYVDKGAPKDAKIVKRTKQNGRKVILPIFNRTTGGNLTDNQSYRDLVNKIRDKASMDMLKYRSSRKYAFNDVWRNFEDLFDEDYEIAKELILDKLDDAKRNRDFIERFYLNILHEEVVEKLGIQKGSKLSKAVQYYGEYVRPGREGELDPNNEKMQEARDAYYSLSDEEKAKVKKADKVFRVLYDSILEVVNDTRRAIYPDADIKAEQLMDEFVKVEEKISFLNFAFAANSYENIDGLDKLRVADAKYENKKTLALRAKKNAEETLVKLRQEIEDIEAKMSECKNKATKKYLQLTNSLAIAQSRYEKVKAFAEIKQKRLEEMASEAETKRDNIASSIKERAEKEYERCLERRADIAAKLAGDGIVYGTTIKARKDYYRHMKEISSEWKDLRDYIQTRTRNRNNKVSPAVAVREWWYAKITRGIDYELVGKSGKTKPKASWHSQWMQRIGEQTEFDAVGGFLEYIEGATYSAAIDPCISMFRQLGSDLSRSATKQPLYGEPEKQGEKNSNAALGNFINYLHEYANDLAGKSTAFDRVVIDNYLGRGTRSMLAGIGGRIKSNWIVGSVSSMIAQVLNLSNVFAYVNDVKCLGLATVDIVKAMDGDEAMLEQFAQSSFLRERYRDCYSKFDIGAKAKVDKANNFMLTLLDEVVTRYIWAAAYRDGIKKGVDAVRHADDITRRAVAGRGIGEVPLIHKNMLVRILAPFTIETQNFWHVMEDIDRNAKRSGKSGFAAARYKIPRCLLIFIGNAVLSKIKEMITGNGEGVFNPIGDIYDGIKRGDNVFQIAGSILGDAVGSSMPGPLLASIYPENGITLIDGIKTPTRSQLFGSNDPTRYGVGSIYTSGLKDALFMLLPPFGGSQLKKTLKGVSALYRGYTVKSNGEKKFDVERSPKNIVRGSLFGDSGFSEADEYHNPQKVKLNTEDAAGFKYRTTKRDITIKVGMESQKVELTGDELQKFEEARLTEYKRLYHQVITGKAVLKNPYSRSQSKKWKEENKKFNQRLEEMVDQGLLTKPQKSRMYNDYASGRAVTVSGVQYVAPVKKTTTKTIKNLTYVQKKKYRDQIKREYEKGNITAAQRRALISQLNQSGGTVQVDEYINGSFSALNEEDKKKILSRMNTLATEKAKEDFAKTYKK